jgi:hypothetical protein
MSTTGEDRRDRPDGDPRQQPDLEDAVLPTMSGDEQATAWGDDAAAQDRDVEWYRRERPPHHE